jgi:hypothetical protein
MQAADRLPIGALLPAPDASGGRWGLLALFGPGLQVEKKCEEDV